MGGFVQKSTTKTPLPKELPDAAEAIESGHPDGAVYEIDGGTQFKLRAARWVPLKLRSKNGSKTKQGSAKK